MRVRSPSRRTWKRVPITCTVTGPACTRKIRDGRRATSKCAPPVSSSTTTSSLDSRSVFKIAAGPSSTMLDPSASGSGRSSANRASAPAVNRAAERRDSSCQAMPASATTTAADASATPNATGRRGSSRRAISAHLICCCRPVVQLGSTRRAAASA